MAQPMRLLAAAVAGLTFVGSATAQPATRQTTTTTTTTEVRRASGIMNSNVVVQDGATVGRITDFVVSEGGCIDYVVVDYDNKYVLVPYQVVRVEGDRHIVQVNITRDKFREIPTFTGNNWPVTDQQYIGRVRSAFGVTESGYRGDRRDGDRRPLAPGEERRDARPTDRRDQPQPPQQRRDAENPNRNPPPAPNPNPPARPSDTNRTPPPPPPDRPSDRPPPPPPPPA